MVLRRGWGGCRRLVVGLWSVVRLSGCPVVRHGLFVAMEIRAHAQIQRLRLFVGRKRTLTLIWLLQKVRTRQMNERIRSFRDLDVWQAGMELVVPSISWSSSFRQLSGSNCRHRCDARWCPCQATLPKDTPSEPCRRCIGGTFGLRSVHSRSWRLKSNVAQRLRMVDEPAIQSVSRKLERTRQLLHGLLRALRAIKEQKPR